MFIVLICVDDRAICCLTYENLFELIRRRENEKGSAQEQYVLLVTAAKGKNFRVVTRRVSLAELPNKPTPAERRPPVG